MFAIGSVIMIATLSISGWLIIKFINKKPEDDER